MILTAKETFACNVDGNEYVIHAGTTVREGHPVIEAYPQMFGEVGADLEWGDHSTKSAPVEEATANPGETRTPAKRGPGRPRGSTTRKAR